MEAREAPDDETYEEILLHASMKPDDHCVGPTRKWQDHRHPQVCQQVASQWCEDPVCAANWAIGIRDSPECTQRLMWTPAMERCSSIRT